MKYNTLDDFEVADKAILVRVDINSPLDPETGEIIDDNRIQKCSETLSELSDRGGKVVVIAHQGRPGRDDFTTLEKHSEIMSQVLETPVKYVDDLFGPTARKIISNLDSGDILLLENARFYSEEVLNRPAEEQAKTHFVKKLSPLADLYVNDAFAAAHRSQPSLVGFGINLPSAAGRLMEREIKGLGKARNPEKPCVYLLGGAKVEDSLKLTDHVLEKGIANRVLIGGLVGQVFLAGKGLEIGEPNLKIISDEGYDEKIPRAEELISKHGDNIVLPRDLRIETGEGNAKVITAEEFPTENPIYDIGDRTIEEYAEIIEKAKTVVANGPVGVFEKPAFAKGTNELLKAIAETEAFTTIGGGHLVASARDAGLTEKIDHVSTGGGSCLSFLSGETLPVLEILERSSR